MRAYQLNAFGIDHLQLTEQPAPCPGPGQVLVKMEAASLNFRDHLLVNGTLYRDVALPLTPVSDGAGTVLEVGEGVTRFRPGDRVTTFYKARWLAGAMRPEWEGADLGGPGPGAMRELACYDAYTLARTPSHMSALQAATLPIAALTAWTALEQAHVTAGQTVLLLGTGGVSLFAMQLAKARGAKVILLSSSDEKLERAKTLGTDIGINYARHPAWAPLVREATDGRGADTVIETVGASTFRQSVQATAMHGFIGIVGFMGGREAEVPLVDAILKRIHLQGISVASLEDHEKMVRALEAIQLQPVLDAVYGFGELRAAFEHLAGGKHFGKIGIDFTK